MTSLKLVDIESLLLIVWLERPGIPHRAVGWSGRYRVIPLAIAGQTLIPALQAQEASEEL
jgi:hypothetical protein